MQKHVNPPASEWTKLLKRPEVSTSDLYDSANSVLEDIRREGDKAVARYSAKYDAYTAHQFEVSADEIELAEEQLSEELKSAIRRAATNIEKFHSAQWHSKTIVETEPGVSCWQKSVPIEKVGLYVPGGTAPLFSTVLMLGIPARIAGCSTIVLCSPPSSNGNINPAILYAAKLAGIKQIFRIGGIQAIGAMAFGTQTVPKVYKIFGPGNRFVTAAKQLVSLKNTAIDMPAGPSEVLIMADETANPAFVAADLLSQAEHGADSQVILLTNSPGLLDATLAEIDKQVKILPRQAGALTALSHSRAFLLPSMEEMMKMSNLYAPEHLILSVRNAAEVAENVVNAGSVFIGHYSPESAGDYASGTNHTLPTHGYARSYSGVNLDSFLRKITFQELSKEGLKNLGPAIELMAEAEMLQAHKNAVTIRLNSLK